MGTPENEGLPYLVTSAPIMNCPDGHESLCTIN